MPRAPCCTMGIPCVPAGCTSSRAAGCTPLGSSNLGRWQSALVTHYAGEAMHQGLAQDLRALEPGVDAEALADGIRRMETRLDALESLPAPIPNTAPGMYILNRRTNCWHWSSASPGWDPGLQRTDGCGWAFMTQRFERHANFPAGVHWHKICERCLPERRAAARRTVDPMDLSDLD